jgi:hypothetical protein
MVCLALRRPIFKGKKVFANFSLSYSMASSHPPSRDTVPLKCKRVFLFKYTFSVKMMKKRKWLMFSGNTVY